MMNIDRRTVGIFGIVSASLLGNNVALAQSPRTPVLQAATAPPADCPQPPYAAELAEVSARAHAQFQISAAKVLQDQLAKEKDSNAKISLSGRMVSAALGGFAAQALTDTFDNYFCRLKVAAGTDAPLVKKLRERQLQIKEAIIVIFDPALYGQSPMPTAEERSEDRQNAKEEHKKIQEEIKAYEPVWTVAAASAAIPNFNYSKVTTFEFNADAVLGPIGDAGICLGMVRKSIRVVKPEVLVALDKARSNAIWWVTGDADFVEQDIRLLASTVLKAQASVSVEAEQQTVTQAFKTCVEETKKAGEAAAPSADPDSETVTNGAVPVDEAPADEKGEAQGSGEEAPVESATPKGTTSPTESARRATQHASR